MRAIDAHCHIPTEEGNRPFAPYMEHTRQYYKMAEDQSDMTAEDFAQMIIDLDVKAYLVSVNALSTTGQPGTSNDHIADLVKRFPDAFLGGYACVDPWAGKAALIEVERAIRELGLHGVKFHTIMQEFAPSDKRLYPLWDLCQSLKVPVQFHTGMTGVGLGMKGSGIHLKYGHPLARHAPARS